LNAIGECGAGLAIAGASGPIEVMPEEVAFGEQRSDYGAPAALSRRGRRDRRIAFRQAPGGASA